MNPDYSQINKELVNSTLNEEVKRRTLGAINQSPQGLIPSSKKSQVANTENENYRKNKQPLGKISTSVKSTWTVNRSQGNCSQIRVDHNRSIMNKSRVSKEFDRSQHVKSLLSSQGGRDSQTA